MTLTQIEYIVAVERNGSFVTAAEKCFVTQPTLSMQIQKLEEELGIKIFDRNHHPIVATDMGKKILDIYCLTILLTSPWAVKRLSPTK